MTHQQTLFLMCGKISSGKSTLAETLGQAPNTVVISEDDWLAALYSDDMSSVADYVRCSAKLRNAMHPHLLSLLAAGVSIVLDFQANTVESRAWLRTLIDQAGIFHELHYLDVPDEVCKARLKARNEGGDHAFSVTEEQFDLISRYFIAPTSQEGFNLVVHRP